MVSNLFLVESMKNLWDKVFLKLGFSVLKVDDQSKATARLVSYKTDPTRPVAPFLPPEITSKILDFLTINEPGSKSEHEDRISYMPLSLLNSGWQDEIHKRFFKSIRIETSSKLGKLVKAMHIRPQLGNLIECLHYLELVFPKCSGFNSKEQTYFRSNQCLPKLNALGFATRYHKDWNFKILDSLISSAPNITELIINSMSAVDYKGPPCSSKLTNLKKFSNSGSQSVLKGEVWKVEEFAGITSLNISSNMMERNGVMEPHSDTIPFFKIVGPTLLDLDATELNLPAFILSTLTSIKSLTFSTSPYNPEDPFTFNFSPANLPSTLHNLVIDRFQETGWPSSDSWSHLTQIEEIHFREFVYPYDFSILPPIQCLKLDGTRPRIVMESLSNIQIGNSPFSKLIVGPEQHIPIEFFNEIMENFGSMMMGLVEYGAIDQRCKELNIEFVKMRSWTGI